MKAINKSKLALTICITGMLTCVTTFAAAPDISGNYTCTGNDPSSNPPNYTDNLVIKKNGDVYNIRFLHTDSTIPYLLGTGIFNKGIDNVLSLIYWNPSNMGGATEVFVIKPDGSLDGYFAENSKSIAGSEICKKSS